MIGHKFTISVTMDVSPFAWCLARAVLKVFQVTPSSVMTNVISQWTLTSAIARALSMRFKNCDFVVSDFLALAIGEVCSN